MLCWTLSATTLRGHSQPPSRAGVNSGGEKWVEKSLFCLLHLCFTTVTTQGGKGNRRWMSGKTVRGKNSRVSYTDGRKAHVLWKAFPPFSQCVCMCAVRVMAACNTEDKKGDPPEGVRATFHNSLLTLFQTQATVTRYFFLDTDISSVVILCRSVSGVQSPRDCVPCPKELCVPCRTYVSPHGVEFYERERSF